MKHFKGFLTILLSFICINLNAQSPKVADILGVTHAGGKYALTSDYYLKEGADKVEALGSEMIKLWFTPKAADAYPYNSNWSQFGTLTSLTQLIQTSYFQNVITRSQFKTIFLVTTEYAWNGNPNNTSGSKWKDGLTQGEYDTLVNEFKELTIYLRTNPTLAGKTFVLQNWEGDNALNFDVDSRATYQDSCIAGMVQWLNARQDGITQGRNETVGSNVMVAGAAEFNHIPVAGNVFNYKTGIDYVVPNLHMDLYSYSNWSSGEGNEWKIPLLLNHIKSKAPVSGTYGRNNIFMGEFGDREMKSNTAYIHAHTDSSDNEQRASLGRQIEQSIKWGIKWMVYWQMYCNGVRPGEIISGNATEDQLQGVWLIRPDGSYTTTHTYFDDILTESLDEYKYINEAENQRTHSRTADKDSSVALATASGGFYNMLQANAVNDSISKRVYIADTGWYEVKVRIVKTPSSGRYRVRIDGNSISNELDGYSAGGTNSIVTLGTYYFDSSIVSKNKNVYARFSFKVTGKSGASSGYYINIDYIYLKKIIPNTASSFVLNNVLQDSMVVQQGKPFNVWGKAAPGNAVSVNASWGSTGTDYADANGNWKVQLYVPIISSGDYTPHSITINDVDTSVVLNDVLIGEVWLASGQSNMSMYMTPYPPFHYGATNYAAEIAVANHSNLRLLTLPRDTSSVPLFNSQGTWSGCYPTTVDSFSVVSYYYAKALQDSLNIPVGMIVSALGSTACQAWTSRAALTADPILKTKYIDPYDADPSSISYYLAPALLYNGMIHPLLNLSLKGFIWYQGESNAGEKGIYPRLNTAMVRGWRSDFNQGDLPFYYVQITTSNIGVTQPYGYSYALFREEQEWIMDSLVNSGMAVTIDVGDTSIVHPSNKKPIGERLAKWALKKTYNRSLVYHGPKFESMNILADTVTINYVAESVGSGLVSTDSDSLKYFYISGTDSTFFPATAIVVGNTVKLYSKYVNNPVAVRYAFFNFAFTNFANAEGLPAYPFRTDSWTGASVIPPVEVNGTMFTEGNIVVMQAGIGATVASGASAPVRVREFTTLGEVGYMVDLPYKTSPERLTYNLVSLGIGLSSDDSKIIVGGYDTDAKTASVSISSAPRVINSIDANGTIAREATAPSANMFSSGIRSVWSDDTNFWGAGSGGGSNAGIMYYGNGTRLQVSSTVSSTRVVKVYNNQLYFSTGAGTSGQHGIYKVGAGTPVTLGNTSTAYLVTAGSGTGTASPYGFVFNSAGDTCYIADDRTITNGGGIQKWAYNGTTWNLQYTLSVATSSVNVGARQLIVDFSGTRPVIYATTSETLANRIVKITDNGSGSQASLLSAAYTNTYYAGICFSPKQLTMPVYVSNFTGSLKNKTAVLRWTAQNNTGGGFIIEKKSGEHFAKIGEVNTESILGTANYTFTDKNLIKGNNQYRLKVYSKDDKEYYTNEVNITNMDAELIKIYPNPVIDQVVVSHGKMNTDAVITINDISGKMLMRQLVNPVSEITSINVKALKAGTYVLTISDKTSKLQSIFIK